MKSKIKVDKRRRIDIPPRFRLEKYEACKNWGLKEWCRAISYRAYIRSDWNKSVRRYFDTEDVGDIYENYKHHARQLLENPLSVEEINWYGKINCIQDQSVADFFEDVEDERLNSSSWRADYLEWAATDYFSRCYTDSKQGIVKRVERTPTWMMKKDVLGQTGIATIHVNFRGTDSDILKAFKEWLKQTRKGMGLPRGRLDFDAATFVSWCHERVLPCFDLGFYRVVHNGFFKLEDIAEALFPLANSSKDSIVGEDQVRRTIIPNSLKVVSLTTAMALLNKLEEAKQGDS